MKANVEFNGTLLILTAGLIVAAVLARELIAAVVRSVIERVSESIAVRPRPMLVRVRARDGRAIPTEALLANQAWRAPPPFGGETFLSQPIRPVDSDRRDG